MLTLLTIGAARRALLVPWDSRWNAFVRDQTAAAERAAVHPVAQSRTARIGAAVFFVGLLLATVF